MVDSSNKSKTLRKVFNLLLSASLFLIGVGIILSLQLLRSDDLIYRWSSAIIPRFSFMTKHESVFEPRYFEFFHSSSIFWIHVYTGKIGFFVGLLQLTALIVGFKRWFHRWVGWAYFILMISSAITSLPVSFGAVGGPISVLGFFTLGLWWLVTLIFGAYFAVKKNIRQHKRWIVRGVMAALPVVIFRIIGLAMNDFFTLEEIWLISSWGCWLPPVLILEVYFWKTRLVSRVSK